VREFLERLNNLKRMPRSGWLFCDVPLSEVEDVAQHSFEVSAITLLLIDELGRSGVKLNSERAISMAIIHDWAEASVTDFPYTALKYLGSKDLKDRMEQRALEDNLRKMPSGGRYLKLWEEYSEKRTPEAKLVHAADYISMLVQAIKYKECGNTSKELCELWQAVHEDLKPYMTELKPVKDLVKEFDKRYSAISS
jgi:putative hydrolase of HD superfamily